MVFPGGGLFYAECVGLGFGHVLVNTVGIGAAFIMLAKIFPAVLQGQSVFDELVNVSLVVIGLTLLWFYGLGLTRRAVQRYNRELETARTGPGVSGGRVVATIVWSLVVLVAVNLLILSGLEGWIVRVYEF